MKTALTALCLAFFGCAASPPDPPVCRFVTTVVGSVVCEEVPLSQCPTCPLAAPPPSCDGGDAGDGGVCDDGG